MIIKVNRGCRQSLIALHLNRRRAMCSSLYVVSQILRDKKIKELNFDHGCDDEDNDEDDYDEPK